MVEKAKTPEGLESPLLRVAWLFDEESSPSPPSDIIEQEPLLQKQVCKD